MHFSPHLLAGLLASVNALFSVSALPTSDPHSTTSSPDPASHHAQPRILILGAGVSGIIAARTLHRHGHSKFLLIEAQGEISGRLKSGTIGGHTSECGANWIQDEKNLNPILCLALKHGQKTVNNGLYGSITTYSDTAGPIDYWSTIASADKAFEAVVNEAGAQIVDHGPDLSVRVSVATVLSPPPASPAGARWDFEYAQTPSQTSWMASHNFTFNLYGDDNFLNIDQRVEAATFLQSDQIVYNATVKSVDWERHSSEHSTHTHPVNVTLANGTPLTADYVICTFSLGMLQNDEVEWVPTLPAWKREATAAFTMATYTKVFVHFAGEDRFWFDTEMALYASSRRGHYPLWQSLDVPATHAPQFLPGSRILFGTVTGDDALEISALSGATEEDVRADVKEVLQNINFPPSWDPDLHQNLRSSVGHGRLRWAGEAGSATWFGFLHGAYADGRATALELIECIRLGDRRKDDFVLRPQGPGRAPVWPGH
ncbi:FAD/NAD(P)-binding domain-containing protein [Schizophyllum commune Loenen D]|nr:FAD/NAD(P)-binding domain-containing protein [Schizophyllum commune Loenen D]